MTTDHPNMPVQPAQDVNAPHSLRGMTPETWACVGCGVNTAPGCPTRAEFEEAFDGGQESVGYNIDERFEV